MHILYIFVKTSDAFREKLFFRGVYSEGTLPRIQNTIGHHVRGAWKILETLTQHEKYVYNSQLLHLKPDEITDANSDNPQIGNHN